LLPVLLWCDMLCLARCWRVVLVKPVVSLGTVTLREVLVSMYRLVRKIPVTSTLRNGDDTGGDAAETVAIYRDRNSDTLTVDQDPGPSCRRDCDCSWY
jgi:hypothetical protein